MIEEGMSQGTEFLKAAGGGVINFVLAVGFSVEACFQKGIKLYAAKIVAIGLKSPKLKVAEIRGPTRQKLSKAEKVFFFFSSFFPQLEKKKK